MFSTFTVQPLLRGVHLDDASAAASESSGLQGRSFLDRSSTVSPSGTNSPVPKSTGIFNRNTRPVVESLDSFGTRDFLLRSVKDMQDSITSRVKYTVMKVANNDPGFDFFFLIENHLYLGTSDGHLLHYVIEEQIASQSVCAYLLSSSCC